MILRVTKEQELPDKDLLAALEAQQIAELLAVAAARRKLEVMELAVTAYKVTLRGRSLITLVEALVSQLTALHFQVDLVAEVIVDKEERRIREEALGLQRSLPSSGFQNGLLQ